MQAHTAEDIAALAGELERQKQTKRDYIVPAKDIAFAETEGEDRWHKLAVNLNMGDLLGNVQHGITPVAHRQFAEKTGIPWAYYERMFNQNQGLLCQNVNTWLPASPKNHLVRTLDGNVRALLSDRFRVLDNIDLFYQTIDVVNKVGAKVTRADLTDTRFYLRALHPEWEERMSALRERHGTDGGNDTVIPGIVVSNSEVGMGGLNVEPFIHIKICKNGMLGDRTLRKVHLGRQGEVGEYKFSDETRQAEDHTTWLQIRDLVSATFDRDAFHSLVAAFNGTAEQTLDAPVEAVDNVVAHFGMSDADKQAILNNLVTGGKGTVFDLIQAVTARANDYEDYDRTVEFQRIGAQLVTVGAKIANK